MNNEPAKIRTIINHNHIEAIGHGINENSTDDKKRAEFGRLCFVDGLKAAKAACDEVFTAANATYRQTRDQHDDGRSSGADECEQKIDQLITEVKQ